jgi:phage terminase small subunit
MPKLKAKNTTAPSHLRPTTREWFEQICRDYELESQHIKLLRLAADAWDRVQEARQAIKKHGLTFVDRFGAPRARPEVKMEIENRTSFARLLRELAIDTEPPSDANRPPPLR